jgi:hypothetical protein
MVLKNNFQHSNQKGKQSQKVSRKFSSPFPELRAPFWLKTAKHKDHPNFFGFLPGRQLFNNKIMNKWPEDFNFFIGSGGMNAVG